MIDEVGALIGIWQYPRDLQSVLEFQILNAGRFERITNRSSNLFKHNLAGFRAAYEKGAIAGFVFMITLELKMYCPKRASVGMGTFIVSRLLEDMRDGEGNRIPANRDNVHKK